MYTTKNTTLFVYLNCFMLCYYLFENSSFAEFPLVRMYPARKLRQLSSLLNNQLSTEEMQISVLN